MTPRATPGEEAGHRHSDHDGDDERVLEKSDAATNVPHPNQDEIEAERQQQPGRDEDRHRTYGVGSESED